MDELLEVERLQVIEFVNQQQKDSKNGVSSIGGAQKRSGAKKLKSK